MLGDGGELGGSLRLVSPIWDGIALPVSLGTMLRLLFGFGGLGTAAVCGVVYQRQWEGGGLRRAAQFYCTLAPIALHYRLLDLSQRWTQRLFGWEPQAQAWEDLHDKYNEQVLGDFLALRGFYIKLGQVGGWKQAYCKDTDLLQCAFSIGSGNTV